MGSIISGDRIPTHYARMQPGSTCGEYEGRSRARAVQWMDQSEGAQAHRGLDGSSPGEQGPPPPVG
jgi:hypothetical protein